MNAVCRTLRTVAGLYQPQQLLTRPFSIAPVLLYWKKRQRPMMPEPRLLDEYEHHDFRKVWVRPPPGPKTSPKDQWTKEKAMFGCYDYQDILGDHPYIHPRHLCLEGPKYVRGFRGNELQRLIRKKNFAGKNMGEEDWKNLQKRINYLYRRLNRKGAYRT
ncbi:PREDICTED: 39S ribosomal protein L51, mitochondrial-like [Branchiostoma belcheri]|uniref:Large ribosomal subunit protein mL51 n=1 Tax=Branchiostoma belcheri TaxID=7741 RepID=A0A6P5A150_BRABE|nr:PREDICTED: 39S ribosomal protein L51, mitochondrial-like [Branchiostoma belcheri]XP_019640060.1 PREDICTED: 39S ribosomal protein L51, mitochondrial-like [Branchiostoma belcheri]